MWALEMVCNDTNLPIEIDSVREILQRIHELRKVMLETLMGALKEGKNLLDKIREIANEGTLDSRPDRIKIEADNGMQVHIKYNHPKTPFQNKMFLEMFQKRFQNLLFLKKLAKYDKELYQHLNSAVC